MKLRTIVNFKKITFLIIILMKSQFAFSNFCKNMPLYIIPDDTIFSGNCGKENLEIEFEESEKQNRPYFNLSFDSVDVFQQSLIQSAIGSQYSCEVELGVRYLSNCRFLLHNFTLSGFTHIGQGELGNLDVTLGHINKSERLHLRKKFAEKSHGFFIEDTRESKPLWSPCEGYTKIILDIYFEIKGNTAFPKLKKLKPHSYFKLSTGQLNQYLGNTKDRSEKCT